MTFMEALANFVESAPCPAWTQCGQLYRCKTCKGVVCVHMIKAHAVKCEAPEGT